MLNDATCRQLPLYAVLADCEMHSDCHLLPANTVAATAKLKDHANNTFHELPDSFALMSEAFVSLRVAERWYPNQSQDITPIWRWLIMPCVTEAVFSAVLLFAQYRKGQSYETVLSAEAAFHRYATGDNLVPTPTI